MKRWYVVQVYAGYEEQVKSDIVRRVQEEGLQDYVGEVLVPSAKLKKMFDVDQERDEQLFPGYILIEVELRPELMRLITSSPRVMRFLGGKDPVAISTKEISRILSQMKGEVSLATEKCDFTEGSEVEIAEGPFAGFVGIIEKVDKENERLTVMVSIFGRMTPVELGFNQVK